MEPQRQTSSLQALTPPKKPYATEQTSCISACIYTLMSRYGSHARTQKKRGQQALSTDEVLALPWKIDKQVAHAAYSVDINFATNLPLI